jgi:hypothetical protein
VPTTVKTFDQWIAAVDDHVENTLGLSISDLVDRPYYDWFENGYTPAEAAEEVIESALSGDF